MAKKKRPHKKSGNQDTATKAIVLATAILNLIKALVDLITYLINKLS